MFRLTVEKVDPFWNSWCHISRLSIGVSIISLVNWIWKLKINLNDFGLVMWWLITDFPVRNGDKWRHTGTGNLKAAFSQWHHSDELIEMLRDGFREETFQIQIWVVIPPIASVCFHYTLENTLQKASTNFGRRFKRGLCLSSPHFQIIPKWKNVKQFPLGDV